MKKKLTIILFIFFLHGLTCCEWAFAQQISMYSHYFYDPMLYNPAYTAANNATNAVLINHTQWTDFKGAPKFTAFALDGNLVDKKVGLGLILMNDRKGIVDRTSGYLSYSYKLAINDYTHLSFGLSLGIVNQAIDFSKALVESNTDPILFSDLQRKTVFDGNAGLAFVLKGLELGVNVPQIFENKINYVDNTNVRLYYAQARHYMGSVKYKFLISETKGISISPEALIHYLPNVPFQYDGNINVDWKDKCWIGATYKSNYAIAANVGFCIHKQLYVGYSYDFITDGIGPYAGLSQEILIHFKFGTHKKSITNDDSKNESLNISQDNKDYEDLISDMQTKVNESENKIKDLEDKLLKSAKDSSNIANQAKPGLNDLIYQQLMLKIDAMFDNQNATPAEIQELRDEIASYLDSDFADASAQKNLKKKYEQLNHSQKATSVLVKGIVLLQKKDFQPNNFSTVSITVSEKETNKLIGIYTPNAITGKYLFILTPGKKYAIKAENKGYQTYLEDFSPVDAKESYELTKEIKLKEASNH